jgi:1-deoxy-D-xylulose-5-phosphate reductoisomerase
MGRKISVDSATLMNKGLETIEAHWLFGLAPEQIDVVVHPQSLVHALVAYRDGALLAELGVPDMRTAIAHALAWPERVMNGVPMLDLVQHGRLDFEPADHDVFRCLPLAYAAMRAGGSAAVVLNAANEVAVAAFLEGRIGFLDIADVVADCLDQRPMRALVDIDTVMHEDAAAREAAQRRLARMQR